MWTFECPMAARHACSMHSQSITDLRTDKVADDAVATEYLFEEGQQRDPGHSAAAEVGSWPMHHETLTASGSSSRHPPCCTRHV